MKQILLVHILITVLFFTVSCDKTDNNSIKTLTINFNHGISLNEVINEIEVIELETNDSSLIKDIRKIEFYKDCIYVYDHLQHIIVIFDEDGKYINRINNKGQGPGEYLEIIDFGINRFTQQIYILDPRKQNLLFYDLHGNIVDIKRLPKLSGCTYISLQFPNKETFMFVTSDSNNRLKVMDSINDSLLLEDFPGNEYNERAYLFSDSLFLPDLSNRVYRYQKAKIEKNYQIDISSLSPELNSKETPEPYDMQSRIAFIKKLINSENIDYIIRSIDETSQFVLLSFIRKNLYYTYVIDKRTGSFFSFNTIDENFNPYIKFMNNDFLIGMHYSEYNTMYESITSASDMDILMNRSEESNPVLIKYYLNNSQK